MAKKLSRLEDAYQVLLATLHFKACLDDNVLGDEKEPTHGEIQALIALQWFLQNADASEQFVEPLRGLIDKLETAFYRRHFGGNLRKVSEEVLLAHDAAMITHLREMAIKNKKKKKISILQYATWIAEANESAHSAGDIKNFLDEMSRGRANDRAIFYYNESLEYIRHEFSLTLRG